jgi:hypothetical protein
MFWDKPNLREQQHRATVLQNLARLEALATARGTSLEIDQKLSTAKLEDYLWELIAGFEKRARLNPSPSEPAESRIRAIWRAMPPLPMKRQATAGDHRRHDLFEHLAFR